MLSFNGHKSLTAYDQYCESLLQRLKNQIDQRLTELDTRQVVVHDINLLIHEVTSQEKRYFPRKCPEDWFLKLQFQIRHQKEQIRDEIVHQSILRYLKLQQRLLERTKELLRHRNSFLKNSSLAASNNTSPSNSLPVSVNGQVEMFQEPARYSHRSHSGFFLSAPAQFPWCRRCISRPHVSSSRPYR